MFRDIQITRACLQIIRKITISVTIGIADPKRTEDEDWRYFRVSSLSCERLTRRCCMCLVHGCTGLPYSYVYLKVQLSIIVLLLNLTTCLKLNPSFCYFQVEKLNSCSNSCDYCRSYILRIRTINQRNRSIVRSIISHTRSLMNIV